MSSTLTSDLQKYLVNEPRVEVSNPRSWACLVGGQTATCYQLPATSFSLSNFNFTIIPPNKSSILDRVIMLQATFTITINGTGSDNILQPGRFGLRNRPLSSIINQLSLQLNGNQSTIQLSQILPAFDRVKQPLEFQRVFGSICPNAIDCYANYGDGVGTNNNPLGVYWDTGSGPSVLPRGAYVGMQITSNTITQAVITANVSEYLILPPLLFGSDNDGKLLESGGFTHLDTCIIQATLANQNRILSYAISGSTPSTSTLSGMDVKLSGTPQLYVTWITPRIVQSIPPAIIYPLQQVNLYSTQSAGSLNSGSSTTLQSNVLQLSSIPLKIYIWAQRSLSDINNNYSNQIDQTDTYCVINSVSIQFNNIAGLLSAASPQQLWQISCQNGLTMSYTEFVGYSYVANAVSGQSTTTIPLCGSMLVLDPAKDFGLESDLSLGSIGNYQMQVSTMNITNQNATNFASVDLNIVCVYDGIMTLSNNSGTSQIGIITKQDVATAPQHHMSYNELTSIYGGGNFFDTIGNIVGKLNDLVKKSGIISNSLSLLPGATGKLLGPAVKGLTGYGEGGILVGGKALSRRAMQKRLMDN